jgi:hypothetical protein
MFAGVKVHSSEEKRAVSASDRLVILETWERASKDRNFNEEEFIDKIAEDMCLHPRGVRRVIAAAVAKIEQKIAVACLTRGQRIADAAGATIDRVMATLEEGLEAETYIVLKDKDGPILGPDGKIQMVSVPNHTARVRAASELASIHGIYAPRAVEVSGEVSHTHKVSKLTNDELQKRLQQAARVLRDIEASGKIIDMPVDQKQSEGGLIG